MQAVSADELVLIPELRKRGKWISEFKVTLVYIMSSRLVRVT